MKYAGSGLKAVRVGQAALVMGDADIVLCGRKRNHEYLNICQNQVQMASPLRGEMADPLF